MRNWRSRLIIASKAGTIEVLKRHGITAKKNYGQNFLTDMHVINKILNMAEPSKEDLILEIGPGIGTLTQYLAERAGKCVAVEIDKAMLSVLDETLANYDNVEVINEDILKTDIPSIINNNGYKNIKVVANLPYYITTPVIMKLLESKLPFESLTVMVQKEVAMRLRAQHSTKDYSSLTLAVQYYADTYLAANVPSNCFIPRPDVDSAVVKLIIKKTPPVIVTSEAFLFNIIKAAFNQRRKTFVNCLYNYEGFNFTKEQIINVLNYLKIDENIRGENLTLEQFALVCNCLS